MAATRANLLATQSKKQEFAFWAIILLKTLYVKITLKMSDETFNTENTDLLYDSGLVQTIFMSETLYNGKH